MLIATKKSSVSALPFQVNDIDFKATDVKISRMIVQLTQAAFVRLCQDLIRDSLVINVMLDPLVQLTIVPTVVLVLPIKMGMNIAIVLNTSKGIFAKFARLAKVLLVRTEATVFTIPVWKEQLDSIVIVKKGILEICAKTKLLRLPLAEVEMSTTKHLTNNGLTIKDGAVILMPLIPVYVTPTLCKI